LVKIEWTEPAARDLEKLDRQVARRILKRLTWLSKNLGSVIPEPLAGELRGAFKLRIGDWRVVYTVEGKTIVIQFVGHRRDIYKTA